MRVVAIERIGARAALVEHEPSLLARIIFGASSTTRIATRDRRGAWRWEHDDSLCDAITAAELERS